MTNLVAVLPDEREEDEVEALRRDKEKRKRDQEQQDPPRGKNRENEEGESSEEKAKDKKKKKKKKKKRKKLKVDLQKELATLFKNTGLDEDSTVRDKFRKKAAKMAKSKKKDKSSGTSSTSSTEEAGEGLEDRALFGESGKVRTIGRRMPGVLCAAAVEEAAEGFLSVEGGLYNLNQGPLPALLQRYHRQMLAPKMSPAMARESQTLAVIADTALRGQIAQSLDLAAQRLKSLEMMSQGVHFSVSQQQELLVKDQSSLSSVTEYREAALRAREESKAKAEAQRPYGSRGNAPKGDGDSWSKGKQKGTGKTKQGKGDGKKGDKEKDGPKNKGG